MDEKMERGGGGLEEQNEKQKRKCDKNCSHATVGFLSLSGRALLFVFRSREIRPREKKAHCESIVIPIKCLENEFN